MRSDLLLKLTKKYHVQDAGRFERVAFTGPHDYVLMELCKEAQQERPDMTRVTAQLTGFDETLFLLAVKRLRDQGLIDGVVLQCRADGMPVSVDLTAVTLTAAGREYEQRLG